MIKFIIGGTHGEQPARSVPVQMGVPITVAESSELNLEKLDVFDGKTPLDARISPCAWDKHGNVSWLSLAFGVNYSGGEMPLVLRHYDDTDPRLESGPMGKINGGVSASIATGTTTFLIDDKTISSHAGSIGFDFVYVSGEENRTADLNITSIIFLVNTSTIAVVECKGHFVDSGVTICNATLTLRFAKNSSRVEWVPEYRHDGRLRADPIEYTKIGHTLRATSPIGVFSNLGKHEPGWSFQQARTKIGSGVATYHYNSDELLTLPVSPESVMLRYLRNGDLVSVMFLQPTRVFSGAEYPSSDVARLNLRIKRTERKFLNWSEVATFPGVTSFDGDREGAQADANGPVRGRCEKQRYIETKSLLGYTDFLWQEDIDDWSLLATGKVNKRGDRSDTIYPLVGTFWDHRRRLYAPPDRWIMQWLDTGNGETLTRAEDYVRNTGDQGIFRSAQWNTQDEPARRGDVKNHIEGEHEKFLPALIYLFYMSGGQPFYKRILDDYAEELYHLDINLRTPEKYHLRNLRFFFHKLFNAQCLSLWKRSVGENDWEKYWPVDAVEWVATALMPPVPSENATQQERLDWGKNSNGFCQELGMFYHSTDSIKEEPIIYTMFLEYLQLIIQRMFPLLDDWAEYSAENAATVLAIKDRMYRTGSWICEQAVFDWPGPYNFRCMASHDHFPLLEQQPTQYAPPSGDPRYQHCVAAAWHYLRTGDDRHMIPAAALLDFRTEGAGYYMKWEPAVQFYMKTMLQLYLAGAAVEELKARRDKGVIHKNVTDEQLEVLANRWERASQVDLPDERITVSRGGFSITNDGKATVNILINKAPNIEIHSYNVNVVDSR